MAGSHQPLRWKLQFWVVAENVYKGGGGFLREPQIAHTKNWLGTCRWAKSSSGTLMLINKLPSSLTDQDTSQQSSLVACLLSGKFSSSIPPHQEQTSQASCYRKNGIGDGPPIALASRRKCGSRLANWMSNFVIQDQTTKQFRHGGGFL